MKKQVTVVEDIPEILPVLPLVDNVVFPYMIFPILIGRDQSLKAALDSVGTHKYILVVSQKVNVKEDPKKDEIYRNGTIAKIAHVLKLPNGMLKILVDGIIQGKIADFTDNSEFLEAKVDIVSPLTEKDSETKALLKQMDELFKEYVKKNNRIPDEVLSTYETVKEADRKLFFIAANIFQKIEMKQQILEKDLFKEQMYEIIKLLKAEVEILRVEKDIESKLQESFVKNHKKAVMHEQIRLLQKELGEEEEFVSNDEVTKLRQAVEKAKMPPAAKEKALDEINKLTKIHPISPEATVSRNYIDWLISVPWSKKTKDRLDIDAVRQILDEDHYGLKKPKERILEHIAVLNLVKNIRGQILCLVGPPGVGKTSLAKSIAKALNRQYTRISLGGLRDEAEIRGHRRTYIGAMPGKILQAMKKAGSMNPLILLDEIDKMAMDFRGDPASAMLEVLDPEQNKAFNDHYLEVDYDLSKVFFITTANVKYNIPLPLLDRMEIIDLSGYLETEKVHIAQKHIIPKQQEMNGLTKVQLVWEDGVINKIITDYTREAGVRSLEREIASVLRKTAKEIVTSKKDIIRSTKTLNYKITSKKVEEYLGVPVYRKNSGNDKSKVGVVNGLAWTSTGGDVLIVEATKMQGSEKLILTGKLGDVMKESASAALSFIRSNESFFGLELHSTKQTDLHIHFPEGAIPKDGPSAGITIATVIASIMSGNPVKADVAMTGEITLQGNILPIGGLNEKLLAAKRAGIKTIIIPKENEKDLVEVQEEIKAGLKIIPVSQYFEAVKYIFEKPFKQTKTKAK